MSLLSTYLCGFTLIIIFGVIFIWIVDNFQEYFAIYERDNYRLKIYLNRLYNDYHKQENIINELKQELDDIKEKDNIHVDEINNLNRKLYELNIELNKSKKIEKELNNLLITIDSNIMKNAAVCYNLHDKLYKKIK